MLRGYRFLIVAVGLAALFTAFGIGVYLTSLNYPKEERYQTYRYATDKPAEVDPAAARQANAQPLEYRAPCHDPKGQSESDLCAQWKAARAAETSALWTERGFWIAVIGSTLLLWQIILTREAVRDTGDATKAMERQNDIAEAAQRPWVKIKANLLGVDLIERRVIRLDWSVDFENVGQMVATNFQPLVKFVPMDDRFLDHMESYMNQFPGELEEIEAVLIPGDVNTWKGQASYAIEYLPWTLKEGGRKDCVLMLIAMARYRFSGDDVWKVSMQGFAIAENISCVDDCHFRYDFPDDLSVKNMHVRKLGRSRAT